MTFKRRSSGEKFKLCGDNSALYAVHAQQIREMPWSPTVVE
jgi:hypothetical protein